MAKLALINRNAEAREARREVREEARRAAARSSTNPKASDEDRVRGAAEAAGAAAQREPDAAAQPLRADRPPARRVPQVRPRPQQAARVSRCAARSPASSRPAGRGARYSMSMTDPIADMLTRIRNAQMTEKATCRDAVLQGEDRHRQGAEGRGLHRRLQGRRRGRKPLLEIALQVLRGPPGDREDRAREQARPAHLQEQGRHPAR